MKFRFELVPQDIAAIRRIVESSGFFTAQEVEVAIELVEDRLEKKAQSDYQFIIAEADGKMRGYSCYGWIDYTETSYDLYWIAVDETARGEGLGRKLMQETEARIKAAGGTRVYAETSGQPKYAPTQAFYEKCGYFNEARVKDFYRPGDDKLIYTKVL